MRWSSLPPLPEGGAYVERFSSLTVTMPLACLINLSVRACGSPPPCGD